MPGKGDTQTAVLPSNTSTTQNGRSQPTRPNSPQTPQPTCGTTAKTVALAKPFCQQHLCQPCRATAKQNRPLPTKTCTAAQTLTNQPASTFHRLANPTTRRRITQNSWLNRVGFCFPKLTPCQNAQREASFHCPSLLRSAKPQNAFNTRANPHFGKEPKPKP